MLPRGPSPVTLQGLVVWDSPITGPPGTLPSQVNTLPWAAGEKRVPQTQRQAGQSPPALPAGAGTRLPSRLPRSPQLRWGCFKFREINKPAVFIGLLELRNGLSCRFVNLATVSDLKTISQNLVLQRPRRLLSQVITVGSFVYFYWNALQ